MIIKNKSSSITSNKKNSETLGFQLNFFSTLVYEPILIKIYMNANIIRTPEIIEGHLLYNKTKNLPIQDRLI